MVWQKLSRRDFGETYRHLDSDTLSASSVKLSQVSWIMSGSSCWNTWTHTHTQASFSQVGKKGVFEYTWILEVPLRDVNHQ